MCLLHMHVTLKFDDKIILCKLVCLFSVGGLHATGRMTNNTPILLCYSSKIIMPQILF